MNILIVDDNESNLYLLNSLLKGYGYTPFQAQNGKEALDLLNIENFDLIISDILMPVMDGFTLCIEIHKLDQYKDIPFIFYTATYTGPKDEDFAKTIGADLFLVKPSEPDIIIDNIKRLTENYQKNVSQSLKSYDTEEKEILKLYNERLVRKLEQKMLEIENELNARIEAEKALRRNEAILNATQQIGKIGGWEFDALANKMYWTNEVIAIHEYESDSCLQNTDEILKLSLSCYAEEDRLTIQNAFLKCCSEGVPYDLNCWFTTFKGNKIYIRTSAFPVFEDGKIVKVYGYIKDETDSKNAQLEKELLNAQLVQSQKLESLGQLAGGVAHDFNNILSIILGYGEILMRTIPSGFDFISEIQEIIHAANRASDLSIIHKYLICKSINI